MASSRESSKTIPQNKQTPNKRERLSAQFGQLDSVVSANWDGDPSSLQDAINRIAADLAALKAKLDSDTGVTDTDYATIKP